DEQLVVVEIQVGVDLVALEQVIAHRQLAEEIVLPECGLLAVPRQREKELRLKARARPLGIEVREERILRLVEHEGRVETRAEPVCKGRFADADGTLDGDIPKLTHSVRRVYTGVFFSVLPWLFRVLLWPCSASTGSSCGCYGCRSSTSSRRASADRTIARSSW